MPYTVVELGKVVITFKDAWVGGASYVVLDVVTDADSSYLCILDAPAGTALTNTSYWKFLAKGTYQLWLAAGNTGTVQDFFDSFKGVKGDDGKSAWEAAVEAGYTHSEQQFGEDLVSIQNKVDKISGKGLSTNDYDDAAETKLAGIEAGAEVNNISDINATDLTDGGATTLHKHALANMDDDATHRIVTDTEKSTWNSKQAALGFTPEDAANKSTDISADAASTTKYPCVKAIKDYADGLVVGLIDDRGSYDASGNTWPTTGGSGTAGAILKGDLWYISVEGTLGGVLAKVGYSIRALVDTPAQTAGNWDMLNVGLGYVPENVANKATSISAASTDTQYPTAKLAYDQLLLKEDKTNKKSTINNSETEYPTSAAVYAANLLNEKIADVKLIQPAIAYYKRVIADSGTVGDKTILANLFTAKLKSLPTTQMLYFPHVGIKQRTSGLNKYASKVYDLGLSNIDAVQATEGTQPYTTVNAAPLSLIGLKYVSGQTQTGEIAFTSKSYLATDSWTLTIVLKVGNAINGNDRRIWFGTSHILLNSLNKIILRNSTSDRLLEAPYAIDNNKTNIIEFLYSNGTGLIKVNGIPLQTTVVSAGITLNSIINQVSNQIDGVLYFAHLQNERISEAESQQNYAILRALIPEIEGVNIGNQHWATSNYEGITDGAGNNIPEVQLATTGAELITNAADREFSSDTGFWTKLATQPIISGGVCTIACSLGGDSYMQRNALLTPGKQYMLTYSIKRNRIGSLSIFSPSRPIDSSVGNDKKAYFIPSSTLFVIGRQSGETDIDIDDISIKECGWLDATAIYNARIAAGDTVKAAALAASMLAGYSNTAANMAIYGKMYNAYGARTIDYASPTNWRVPSYASWLQMATALGGNTVAGGRLKKDTTVYFTTPNMGATNESGFSAIANGLRGIDGAFSVVGEQANFWTSDGYLVTLNYNAATITFTAGADPRIGAAIRLMRNEPVGNDMEVVSTGWFTTNIASSAKSILCKFGYLVRAINISTTPNITGIEAKLYNAAGSAVATLFTNQACNATTINFDVGVNQPELFQDGTVRITATGNGATGTPPLGMKIEVIYSKCRKSV